MKQSVNLIRKEIALVVAVVICWSVVWALCHNFYFKHSVRTFLTRIKVVPSTPARWQDHMYYMNLGGGDNLAEVLWNIDVNGSGRLAAGDTIYIKLVRTQLTDGLTVVVNLTFADQLTSYNLAIGHDVRVALTQEGSASIYIFNGDTLLFDYTFKVYELCSRITSMNYSWQHSSIDGHNRWIPRDCLLLNTTLITTSASPLPIRQLNLHFLGNSHIRNLFRCSADVLSDGKSLLDAHLPAPCNKTALNATRGANHCLSCLNVSPLHGFDYSYSVRENGGNITLHDQWVVVYDVATKVRKRCEQKHSSNMKNNNNNNAERVECMLQSVTKDAGYRGHHLGIEVLQRLSRFLHSDESTFLVLNLYLQLNPVDILKLRLIPWLKQYQNRVILIVDAHAGPKFEQLIRLLGRETPKLSIIDLRYLYAAYESKIQTQDIDGAGFWNKEHIYAPLQRVLVQTVMTEVQARLLRHDYASFQQFVKDQ
ncbi:hypothetical protein MP228_002758 [Amoeboaphelidium protococcarum]|nr:hypothetical protein MP228_002758 [Amoeboaphelidium protococcarum]